MVLYLAPDSVSDAVLFIIWFICGWPADACCFFLEAAHWLIIAFMWITANIVPWIALLYAYRSDRNNRNIGGDR